MKFIKYLSSFLIVVFLFDLSFATEPVILWEKKEINDAVLCINHNPVVPEIIYIGTQKKGILRSGDGGITFEQKNQGIGNNWTIADIEIYPVDPKIVFIVAKEYGSLRGLFRSTNGGENWEKLEVPGGSKVLSITFSPNGTLYAGLEQYGVFRSTDMGNTWRRSSGGGEVSAYSAHHLFHHPTKEGVLIGGFYTTGIEKGLYYTTNSGEYWFKDGDGLPEVVIRENIVQPRVQDLIIEKKSGVIYYAGFNDGGVVAFNGPKNMFLYKSLNSAENWVRVGPGIEGQHIYSLYMHPDNIFFILAGSDTNGIYYSDDAGVHWYKLYSNYRFNRVNDIDYIPVHSGYYLVGTNDDLFIGRDVTSVKNFEKSIFDFKIFPHPFTSFATFEFELQKSCFVSLSIYDLAGKLINRLIDKNLNSGRHKIIWDAKTLSGSFINPGVFIYELRCDTLSFSSKILFLGSIRD